MGDSIIRSHGGSVNGLPDEYADGKAAQLWYVGCKVSRSAQYKKWLVDILKDNNCTKILDTSCGTGDDSILLVEEGFAVISTDASDQMLKVALKERWNRRKERNFDSWVIEEANWLTLEQDLLAENIMTEGGFDAAICLGNSFAHLPDESMQIQAITNFKNVLKPGGLLLVDHRNFDDMLRTGKVPQKSIKETSHSLSIKCSSLYVEGQPRRITLDYGIDRKDITKQTEIKGEPDFRLSYYPLRLDPFSSLLKSVFGQEAKYDIYGEFKPLGEIETPLYYNHAILKN